MPIDPNIVLGIRNPQEVALGYESIVSAQQANQAKQQAALKNNFLQQLLAQPDAIDKDTGLPTTNTLAKVSRIDPQAGLKMATEISQIQERKIQGEHAQSETMVARQKANASALSEAMGVYDADMKSGDVSPQIAEQNLRKRLHDHIMEQPVSEDEKQRLWSGVANMKPEQLRVLSTTSEQRAAAEKLEKERTPMVMGGMPVLVDKLGNVYDPNNGEKVKVTAPLQKEGAALDPERAAFMERSEKLKEKLAAGSAAELTDDDLKFAGSIVANGQPMPNMGYGAAGAKARAKILHYAAEQATKEAGSPEAAGAGVVVRKDILASDKSALQAATKQEQSVRQFSQTAMGLADKVEGLMDKVAARGPEAWTKFVQNVKTKVLADEDTREFLGYMTDLQSENAKIMAGSTGSVAQVSAHNQDMMSHMLTGDLPLSEIKGGLKAVREGIKMRNASVSDELQRQRAQIRADASGGGAAAAKAAAGELAQPRSREDYDALPSGAHYIKPGDKPGTYRVKP